MADKNRENNFPRDEDRLSTGDGQPQQQLRLEVPTQPTSQDSKANKREKDESVETAVHADDDNKKHRKEGRKRSVLYQERW